jgi:hypothetical protein
MKQTILEKLLQMFSKLPKPIQKKFCKTNEIFLQKQKMCFLAMPFFFEEEK